MLAVVIRGIEPPSRPRRFEAEGAILRQALTKVVSSLSRQIDQLEAAVEGIRPFLQNPDGGQAFPNALITLNRAVNQPRPTIDDLRQLERLAAEGKRQGE